MKIGIRFGLVFAGLSILALPEQASAVAVAEASKDLKCDKIAECIRNLNPFRKDDACECMNLTMEGCNYKYTGGGGSGSGECARNDLWTWWNCPAPVEHRYPSDRKAWKPKGCFPKSQQAEAVTTDDVLNEIAGE